MEEAYADDERFVGRRCAAHPLAGKNGDAKR
jgi:hypothetical protein